MAQGLLVDIGNQPRGRIVDRSNPQTGADPLELAVDCTRRGPQVTWVAGRFFMPSQRSKSDGARAPAPWASKKGLRGFAEQTDSTAASIDPAIVLTPDPLSLRERGERGMPD